MHEAWRFAEERNAHLNDAAQINGRRVGGRRGCGSLAGIWRAIVRDWRVESSEVVAGAIVTVERSAVVDAEELSVSAEGDGADVVDVEEVPGDAGFSDVETPSTAGAGVSAAGANVVSTANESSAASSAPSIMDSCGVPRTDSAA
jgi:hypothetical protein